MFSGYQQREEYEDELYSKEDDDGDSSLSEPNSELEFRLYSQLHYGMEDQEDQEDQGDQGDGGGEMPEEEPLRVGQKSAVAPVTVPVTAVEVIVIDSGPDAITISDNTDDEDSVCARKGQRSRDRCRVNRKGLPSASLPQRRVRSGKARNVMEEVVVLDSKSEESSDSDSVAPFVEDSDSDSDSDRLESWMILGQDKEEGDQDIQLNLSAEGGGRLVLDETMNNGGDEQNWTVSDKDKEAQIFNKGAPFRRMSNRYYTKKTVTCRSCGKVGHLSKNCPNPKKMVCCALCGLQGHWLKNCPNRPCSNCSLPGHTYDDCLERPYWHKHCFRCSMTGHHANTCPDVWRQYHLTTVVGLPFKALLPNACRSPAYCYNCSRKGHFGHECSDRRMFNGTYPTMPLISFYDTQQDIRRRDHWAKKRVKELQEAGLIESTEAPQPLRKKQKTMPQKFSSAPRPAPHGPKRRIAHTPKHPPKSTPARYQQATPSPHSAFAPQLQGKKKKKNKKKNLIAFDHDSFPRSLQKSTAAGGAHTPGMGGTRSPGMLFHAGKSSEKSQKKKNRAQKRARKAAGDKSGGAPDEDLFTIKQRKRSR